MNFPFEGHGCAGLRFYAMPPALEWSDQLAMTWSSLGALEVEQLKHVDAVDLLLES